MSISTEKPITRKAHGRQLLEACIGFVVFGGLGWLARFVPVAFHLMGMVGFVLPLVWGKLTGRWSEMGFSINSWRLALLWGIVAGVATGIIGLVTVPAVSLAPDLGLQLALGIPFAMLLASPFQEFFFRGWLQTRLEAAVGEPVGLLLCSAGFVLWHYLTPFDQMPGWAYPLNSLTGFLGTLAAGLIYGYSFQRSRSILAPWLAHGLAMIVFAAVGVVTFSELGGWVTGG